MPTFIALLRAVNVGGTGRLPMSDLKLLCAKAGFSAVQTYIASGNVVFESDLREGEIKAALEAQLLAYAGGAVGVLVRSSSAMADVIARNPFSDAAANRTVAVFLDEPPADDALATVIGQRSEMLRLGAREIYIHYCDGIATSKLRIPAAASGTARNMNTVAKLASMAGQPSPR